MTTRRRSDELDPPEYKAWCNMRQRCRNPRASQFPHYGARGITVCERWESFENFLADVGPRPSAQHSLDRINVHGNYEPGNCRWATKFEQMANTTRNRFVTVDGKRVIQSEAARIVGLSVSGLRYRLHIGAVQ